MIAADPGGSISLRPRRRILLQLNIYFVWMTNRIDTEDSLTTLDRNGGVKLL